MSRGPRPSPNRHLAVTANSHSLAVQAAGKWLSESGLIVGRPATASRNPAPMHLFNGQTLPVAEVPEGFRQGSVAVSAKSVPAATFHEPRS